MGPLTSVAQPYVPNTSQTRGDQSAQAAGQQKPAVRERQDQTSVGNQPLARSQGSNSQNLQNKEENAVVAQKAQSQLSPQMGNQPRGSLLDMTV
jgi:hypothetical protein